MRHTFALIQRHSLWGIVLLMLAGGVWLLLWLKPPSTDYAASTQPLTTRQTIQLPPQTVVRGILPVLAPALQNTIIDCPITTTQQQLVLSRGVRTCFDYFLSAGTDVLLAEKITSAQQYLKATLPEPAAQTALQLLDQYTQWQAAEHDAAQPVSTSDAHQLQAVLLAAAQRRQRFFSPAQAKAFFGVEDPAIVFTLSQLAIMTNDQWSATQKASKIARLIHQAPAIVTDDMRTTVQLTSVQQLTQALQGQANGQQEVRIIRQQLLGAEAAHTLNALDDAKQALRQQITAYLDARALLLQSTPESEQEAVIQALRERTFASTSEQNRAQRYEAVRDRGEPLGF